MRKLLYWCGALLTLATVSGAALADPHGGMGMHGDMMKGGMGHEMMGGMGEDHFDRINNMHTLAALNLTDEQRKKVMDLRRELRNNTWDLQRQVIDQREQLGMLYRADTLAIAAIKSAYEKLFQAKLKMIEFSLKYKQELFKVLSAEQRQRLMHGMTGGGEEDDSDM